MAVGVLEHDAAVRLAGQRLEVDDEHLVVALDAPELGLSNWQFGRMLGRGAILSGDSVHTIRYRATIADHDVHR